MLIPLAETTLKEIGDLPIKTYMGLGQHLIRANLTCFLKFFSRKKPIMSEACLFFTLKVMKAAFRNRDLPQKRYKPRINPLSKPQFVNISAQRPKTKKTGLITMGSKPNYFEVAFLLLLFFCLVLLIFLSLDKCHCAALIHVEKPKFCRSISGIV